jgi:drug/metabolite transporter superfamily protein YnfA
MQKLERSALRQEPKAAASARPGQGGRAQTMNVTLLMMLIAAAVLEISGDAAMRQGLLRSAWPWFVLGAAILTAYGLAVNVNRVIDFGRVMGLYIAVFFIVSQVLSFVFFGERPTVDLLLGGALIVAGGVVIHLGSVR